MTLTEHTPKKKCDSHIFSFTKITQRPTTTSLPFFPAHLSKCTSGGEKKKKRRRKRELELDTIARRSSENSTYKNTLTGVKWNHPGFDGSSQKRRKEQSVCHHLRSPRRSNFAPHLNVAAQNGTERRAGEVKGGVVVAEGPGGGKSTARFKEKKKKKEKKIQR